MLLSQYKQFIEIHPEIHSYYIAYSGGLDSHVLLFAFLALRKQFGITVKAIHINHGLSSNALSWQQHCEQITNKFNIPFQIEKIKLDLKKGDSLEAIARTSRYQAFKPYIKAGHCLVTGHHADDQAETLLLQLLRGAGVKGLAAMPFIQTFEQGLIWRPLLTFTRQQLSQFALESKYPWIHDESNDNITFSRNYLRHEIIPKLQMHWPAAIQTITRSAEHCAEAAALLTEIAMQDLSQCQNENPAQLNITTLRTLSTPRQINAIRYFISNNRYLCPSEKKMRHIISDLIESQSTGSPCVIDGELAIRRYQDHLYLTQASLRAATHEIIQWPSLLQPCELPEKMGFISASAQPGGAVFPPNAKIEIRFRSFGEKIQLPHRDQHHKLKKCLQDWQVPPWERGRIPLIYCNNELAVVVGHVICKPFTAASNQMGWHFSVSK